VSEPVACGQHSETEAWLDVVVAHDGGLDAVPARHRNDRVAFIGELPAAAWDPAIIGRWRHFKGDVYEFFARVRSKQEGDLLLYRDRSGGVWLRPWSMVFETIERNGGSLPRFRRVAD
jgi:uncharacterized protein DUF1653